MGETKSGESFDAELGRLFRFMAARRFVASRDELTGAGFAGSRIKSWLRSRRLVAVLRGVYSYGRDVESREAAWRASLVAAGGEAVLTGRSACEAWGIVNPQHRIPREVEVAVDKGARHLPGLSPALSRTRVKFVRRQLEPRDVRRKDGLRLVRPALALIEFAAGASDRDVRFAFLEACRLGLFQRSDVDNSFARITGRRGATKLRPLLAVWVPELGRIRSVFEGAFLLAWAERGLPMPKVNAKVCGYEVDAFWPERGVIVELDGRAFHSDPAHRAIDAAKQTHLEHLGYTVIRITYAEFEANPQDAIHRVAAGLGFSRGVQRKHRDRGWVR